jgi:hypothetical protein
MNRAEKLAYLNEVAATVRTIQALIQVGADTQALREFARNRGDVVIEETPGAMVLRLRKLVSWHITLDHGGAIIGYRFDGLTDLMEDIGIDFSGNDFTPH